MGYSLSELYIFGLLLPADRFVRAFATFSVYKLHGIYGFIGFLVYKN
jgi:hypothetical protein